MAIIDKLRELVEPLCADLALEIYDLELNGGVFRVAVDKEGGVGMTDIAELTRCISRALDVHDPISGHYTLEVSSPGMERPLERSADFERFKGSRVRVKMPGEFGRRQFTGVLGGLEEGSLILEVAGGRLERIQLDQIERVRLDLTFDEFMRLAERPLAERGELP